MKYDQTFLTSPPHSQLRGWISGTVSHQQPRTWSWDCYVCVSARVSWPGVCLYSWAPALILSFTLHKWERYCWNLPRQQLSLYKFWKGFESCTSISYCRSFSTNPLRFRYCLFQSINKTYKFALYRTNQNYFLMKYSTPSSYFPLQKQVLLSSI